MAFSDFKYPDVVAQLGLTEGTARHLFTNVPPVPAGPLSRVSLPIGTQLGSGAHSEFARSVWMVGPVLGDLWDRYDGQICLNGAAELDGDAAAKLTGVCDFVISRGPQRHVIGTPVLVMFEAKRDSIPDGLGQCIAAMVGAQRFNRRAGVATDPMYGCVTTGTAWKFLSLTGTVLATDANEYTLRDVDQILGILVHMIGPLPTPATP